jgi:hypothetical protein
LADQCEDNQGTFQETKPTSIESFVSNKLSRTSSTSIQSKVHRVDEEEDEKEYKLCAENVTTDKMDKDIVERPNFVVEGVLSNLSVHSHVNGEHSLHKWYHWWSCVDMSWVTGASGRVETASGEFRSSAFLEVPRGLHVAILVCGTRGDVQPFVIIGQALQKDG